MLLLCTTSCWHYNKLLTLQQAVDITTSCWYYNKLLTLQQAVDITASCWHYSKLLTLQQAVDITTSCWYYNKLLTLQQAVDITASCWHYNKLLTLQQAVDITTSCWHYNKLLTLQQDVDITRFCYFSKMFLFFKGITKINLRSGWLIRLWEHQCCSSSPLSKAFLKQALNLHSQCPDTAGKKEWKCFHAVGQKYVARSDELVCRKTFLKVSFHPFYTFKTKPNLWNTNLTTKLHP
jgi:uncharacterized membrane protein (GlpM family)